MPSLASLIRVFLLPRAALVAENLALRHQLGVLERHVARPRFRTRERLFWVLLRRIGSGWSSALLLVQPATVIAWHRRGWLLLWRRKSRPGPGRPPIGRDVRELIRRLSRENRLWGAPRIRVELARLGHEVAKSTVEKDMARHGGPSSPTWRTFLGSHADEILACDFFKITTVTFQQITGFVVMDLARRRILAIEVTAGAPTGEWAASVVKRAFLAGGAGRTGRYLLRDRDGVYGHEFRAPVRAIRLRQVLSAYRAPKMNAHGVRLIGTLRRECLDHVIVFGESHARRVLEEYAEYYNHDRPHQALGGDTPVPGTCPRSGGARVVAEPVLGGLHHRYRRAA